MKLLMQLSPATSYFLCLRSKHSPQQSVLIYLQCVVLVRRVVMFQTNTEQQQNYSFCVQMSQLLFQN